MTRTLFAATACLALLSACDMQGSDTQAANKTENLAAQNVPANAASPLGAPVSGDQAKQVMHERHRAWRTSRCDEARELAAQGRQSDLARSAKRRHDRPALPPVKGWFPPAPVWTWADAGQASDLEKPELRREGSSV